MFSSESEGWIYKDYEPKGKAFWWFSLPHIDSELLGGNQYFIGRGGWIKEQNGSYYMIPDPCGGSRVWFGTRTAEDRMFEGKSFINSPESQISARVDYVPKDCKTLGFLPELSNQFFENPWNFYSVEYVPVFDKDGPVINERGNPEIDKFTRLMTPDEVKNYCKGWIAAIEGFPDDGMAKIGFKGTASDIAAYFGFFQNLSETASRLNALSRPALPDKNSLYSKDIRY